MKVKVCGLREPENITAIVDLGVDFVGFIFYDRSSRFVGNTKLAGWLGENEALFAKTKKVGVFVNAEVDFILNTVHDYKLDYVQLHGNESAGYCRELKLLWSASTLRKAHIIKAFSIDDDFDFRFTNAYADSCPLFVFDTGGQKEHGGTGVKWNWAKLDKYHSPIPFLLSGGIGPEDAESLQRLNHPQFSGIDVNSRFEEKPGLKDTNLLKHFLAKLG